jgi:hypothetical protein
MKTNFLVFKNLEQYSLYSAIGSRVLKTTGLSQCVVYWLMGC